MVGKTTVATALADALCLPIRNCGDVVRFRAKELGISISELEDSIHTTIDADTVEWATSHSSGCVVEGRFLDSVLAGTNGVSFVRLIASYEARAKRCKIALSLDDLKKRDAEDHAFRNRLFTQPFQPICYHAVDTSELSVSQCVEKIQSLIS